MRQYGVEERAWEKPLNLCVLSVSGLLICKVEVILEPVAYSSLSQKSSKGTEGGGGCSSVVVCA